MKSFATHLVFLLAVFSSLSCSYNQTTRRPELVLTSKETEQQLGEREAAKVEAAMGLVDDPQLTEYVSAIGQRLAAQSPSEGYEFDFYVVDMKEPNAFALPGGKVYVSRGILALANSEDELAGVIGHEVAHVLGRHTGHRITLGAPLTLVTGITAGLTSIISPGLGNLIGGIGGATQGILLSPYDRHQERQADDLGLKLAAGAGWDPAALSHILHSLEREEDLRGSGDGLAFFASHPRTPERVRNTGRAAKKLQRGPGEPIAASRAQFLAKLDGLVVADNPARGVFDGGTFIQPEMGFALQFPKEWKHQNSPDQVIAAPSEEDAVVILKIAGEGDDPKPVAEAVAKKQGLDASKLTREVEINGLEAVRSRSITGGSRRKKVAVEATWIAFGGAVYQIVSATSPDDVGRYHNDFVRIPHSFHDATPTDLARVKVDRLRLRKARRGETIAGLVARVGSIWTADEAAIANAVETDTVLDAGFLAKAPERETYRPKRSR